MKKILPLLLVIHSFISFSHESHQHDVKREKWLVNGNNVNGNFLMFKDGKVFIEMENNVISTFQLEDFSTDNQELLNSKIKKINHLNKELIADKSPNQKQSQSRFYLFIGLFILSFGVGIYFYFFHKRYLVRISFLFLGIGLISVTDPNIINDAFLPFSSDVNTSWDNNYFYVESQGIPSSHEMMVGISNHGWQQQVPIPQCYFGSNSWSIPLNPVLASNPIPVDQIHFTRGAIAIAVNGVPIFNPHTNTGVDALADGQLDNYGGHSGKGDDYHYHTAPLHLYNQTTSTLPIAYAFDGFAVFGSLEPDGVSMTPLDANHGHFYNGTYHYHGTTTYPYMIANMVGQVTEDATNQLIPQASAHPVRTENWTPLNGALITSCTPNTTNNGYNLTYMLNGVSGYATNYSWNVSVYSFDYVTPNGSNTINYNGFVQCTDQLNSLFNLNSYFTSLIYPNPFDSKIHIANPSISNNYILHDPFGKIIYSGQSVETKDFSYLPNGTYFLIINDKTYKLIKK